MKIRHVLSVKGNTASADGRTWRVNAKALRRAEDDELFDELFPRGPGRKWYNSLPADAPLFILAEEDLQDIPWETLMDDEGPLAMTRGVARVVEGYDGRTLSNLGYSYQLARMMDEASDVYAEAIDLTRKTGDRLGEAQAMLNLGVLRAMLDDTDEAVELLKEALALSEELSYDDGVGNALGALAEVYKEEEDWGRAEECAKRAVQVFAETENPGSQALTLNNLGLQYAAQERWLEARACYEQSLDLSRDLDDLGPAVATLCSLSELWYAAGDPDKALNSVCEALELGARLDEADATYLTGHLLEFSETACLGGDWDFVGRLAEAAKERIEPLADDETLPLGLQAGLAVAHVATAMMYAAAISRGDASDPRMQQTTEMARQFDEVSGSVFGFADWLDAVCDRPPGGGLRLV